MRLNGEFAKHITRLKNLEKEIEEHYVGGQEIAGISSYHVREILSETTEFLVRELGLHTYQKIRDDIIQEVKRES